jgi:hypothetical protein
MKYHFLFFLLLTGLLTAAQQRNPLQQIPIPRVNQMADVPRPLHIIDYHALALEFDSTIYDFHATGKFWPMVWIDSTQKNFPQNVVGMYTAVGDVRQGPDHNNGMFHEALANMGSVLGATLSGLDKSRQQGRDYVGMLKNYFNSGTGWNIMMNNTCPEVALLGGGYGRDWWYDVYPNLLFYAIYDQYPDEPGFTAIARSIADKFYQADSILHGNYNWSFFNYGTMQPMRNQICAQPDVAAGHAWLLYCAFKKFGDPRYLQGATSALNALQSQPINPTYELLMPFGAYLAARINAERGLHYDINKMLAWTFDGTAVCREGWGILAGNWNGIEISGIVGSTVDHGGYGFLMNTYDAAWPLLPLVRYNPAYAAAIGKWMLNAANAARLFYPQYMLADHQTHPELTPVAKGVIAYEGIIKQSPYPEGQSLKGPVAQGDGPLWVAGQNPAASQLSVYGSAHAGIFGSIIKTTNVDGILQLDLLATDFYHDSAYPSFLYYNPWSSAKTVTLTLPSSGKIDLYNAASEKFIARGISRSYRLALPPKTAAVLLQVPIHGKVTRQGNKLLVEGVVIDYQLRR